MLEGLKGRYHNALAAELRPDYIDCLKGIGGFNYFSGALPAVTPWACPKQSPRRRRPPGARASRPHALPLRTAQFPCDAAPDHPAGKNGTVPAEAESWRRCGSIPVEEIAEAVPGRVRAGRPRSRVGLRPATSTA